MCVSASIYATHFRRHYQIISQGSSHTTKKQNVMANAPAPNYQNPPGHWVEPDHVPSVTEILGCCPDYGNPQLAYKILGLHSTRQTPFAHRPDAVRFIGWCNRVAGTIYGSGESSRPGSVQHRRFLEANRRLLSAIHSLAGMRRPRHDDWKPSGLIHISPWQHTGECNDAPLDMTLETWDQMVVVPLSFADFQRHYGSIKVERRDQMAREEEKERKAWLATRHMIWDAKKQELHDLKDIFSCYGFCARPFFKFPQDKPSVQKRTLDYTFYAAPVPRDENSLWYSLALLIENRPTDAKGIKAKVANWLYQNLLRPKSGRFRMYHHLLAESVDCVDEDDVNDWGMMDLLRCLNRNDAAAGMPREAGFHEMLHLVADYLDTEVITFTRPPFPDTYYSGDRGMKKWLQENPYEMRVYGNQSSQETYQLSKFQNRKQILLVTDPGLRHFQPVLRVTPELPRYEAGDRSLHGRYLPTGSFDVWDRHMPMPWWPGFRWDADHSRWTGDWEDDDLRRHITIHQKLSMKPCDITTGIILHSVSKSQLQGPYFANEPAGDLLPELQTMYDLRNSYDGDADTGRKALFRWSKQSRLTWTKAATFLDDPLDPAPRFRDFDARIGSTQFPPRFKSKRQWDAMASGGRDYSEQINIGRHEDCGWLRIEATEMENRRPDWHDSKRRRKVAGSS
ncbi:hypothetical protein CTA2_9681 [Colletotrichum tanaceti]|uniref:Uncharacterized protein n=1 Tax=Colletotrichum tanaceti TaxID=1306861 RepID=A0A4U6XRX5_9PEZI|nr:hypothetical protein CTA2_9681 [Colletotrichum tanaceti]TKW58653.1 hypothetical protein CTA1_9327 [Colletotrichum tanaceti]